MRKQPARLPDRDEQNILDRLCVRLIEADEQSRFDQLLCQHHYLHTATLVGEQLRYVAEYRGLWLALLTWNAAALHLCHRDQWIGWSADQRRRRLALVANNSRFCILPDHHLPNLASRVMACCLRRLRADWQAAYGHAVLVAESFVDGQQFCGTTYKVSGWTALGLTDGWGRTAEDYYVKHDRPKQLWVRELVPGACEQLRAESLPAALQSAECEPAPRCSWAARGLRTAAEYFARVPDGRARIGRYPIAGLLAVVFCATLCGVVLGQRDLAAFGRSLSQGQRHALRFRRDRKSGRYPAPCETTYFRLLKRVEPQRLQEALLGAQEHLLGPRAAEDDVVAVDGKTLCSAGGLELVSALAVKSGRWLGTQAVAADSNEIPAAQQQLSTLSLEGQTAVLDALHTQADTARVIVQEAGGDYLLTVKGNQKGIAQSLQGQWEASRRAFPPCGASVAGGANDGDQSRATGGARGGVV